MADRMVQINKFSVPPKTIQGGYIEPDIDDSLNFTCDYVDGQFVVHVEDASAKRVTELKAEYTFIGYEEKPAPVDPKAASAEASPEEKTIEK